MRYAMSGQEQRLVSTLLLLLSMLRVWRSEERASDSKWIGTGQADGCYARKAKVKAVEGRLSRLDLCWLNRLPRPLTRSESVHVPLG
jgi:hypothetical protein